MRPLSDDDYITTVTRALIELLPWISLPRQGSASMLVTQNTAFDLAEPRCATIYGDSSLLDDRGIAT
jgi:hypothetical protein